MGMLQKCRLPQLAHRNVFADDHRKFATGIGKSLRIPNTSQIFYWERPTSAGAVSLKSLLLSNAVRVPCHGSISWLENVWAGINFLTGDLLKRNDEVALKAII